MFKCCFIFFFVLSSVYDILILYLALSVCGAWIYAHLCVDTRVCKNMYVHMYVAGRTCAECLPLSILTFHIEVGSLT